MATLSLAPVLDIGAATTLRALLIAHRGADLEIDAAAVERMGGLCLQVLLAGRQAWARDGRSFRIRDPSAPCLEALKLTQSASALGLEG